jgi:hypothetical protein
MERALYKGRGVMPLPLSFTARPMISTDTGIGKSEWIMEILIPEFQANI